MSQKTYNHKSESGKDYKIHGSNSSGYRATDVSTGKSSVYATDTRDEMHRHIENVEHGKQNDVDGFAK